MSRLETIPFIASLFLLSCQPTGGARPEDTGAGGHTGECTYHRDDDEDGYGDPDVTTNDPCDAPPDGYVEDATDCDDDDGSVHPGATEVCDGIDNDCDGEVDPDTAEDAPTWYLDADMDGYGLSSDTVTACEAPTGYASEAGDCDDDDPARYPGAEEACDDVDNDCDGIVDNPSDGSCAGVLYDDGSICPDLVGTDLGSVPAWEGGCDEDAGFVAYGNACYHAVEDDTAIWADARATCAAAGGWLATLDHEAENEFVATNANRALVGACEPDNDGDWYWVTGESWDYTAWDDGKPDDKYGDEVVMVQGTDGTWNDIEADATKGGFMCEFGPVLEDRASICGDWMGEDLGDVPTWDGICDEDSGYAAFEDHCYYFVDDNTAVWPDARATCAAAGGWLATIGSSEENDHVAEIASRPLIGGCDADEEGTWQWVTGEAWEYEHWDEGKPEDLGNEDALVQGNDGTWNDIGADVTKDGYVCEFAGVEQVSATSADILDDGSTCPHLWGIDLGTVPPWTGACEEAEGYVEYDESCYYPVDSGANWVDARTTCAKAGGYLAVLADEDENTFFHDTWGTLTWIGGCEPDGDGTWVWLSDETWDYTNWESSQPGDDGTQEDCLALSADGTWHDYPDDWGGGFYVCEFPVGG